MFPFTKTIITWKNLNPWKLTPKYLILHHTGVRGTVGNIAVLTWQRKSPVSVHFLIGDDGDTYKLAEPTSICRHAWVSQWGNDTNLNNLSLGIEITWPWFTLEQYKSTCKLTKYLMDTFKIPAENVLTHASVTRAGSKWKFLRDWKSQARKVDPNRSLRADHWFESFNARRQSL